VLWNLARKVPTLRPDQGPGLSGQIRFTPQRELPDELAAVIRTP
jgi:hypothetical protein